MSAPSVNVPENPSAAARAINPSPIPAPGGPVRRRLRSVPAGAPRMARFPFLLILMGVCGVGMAGLLMVNTTLQNQTFTSRTLQQQANQLTLQQVDLQNRLAAAEAPGELARRASAIGMRPNPYPAVLVMPKGKVVGKPTPVVGNEVKSLVIKPPEQLRAEKLARAQAKAQAEAKVAAKAKAKAEKAQAKAQAEAEKAKAKAKAAKADQKAKAKADRKAKKKSGGQG